jgi:hypothetical protein
LTRPPARRGAARVDNPPAHRLEVLMRLTRPTRLLCLAAVLAALPLSGCAVVSVAGAAAGAAISVTGAVVSTGVKVTGKVIEKTVDAVTPDSGSGE